MVWLNVFVSSKPNVISLFVRPHQAVRAASIQNSNKILSCAINFENIKPGKEDFIQINIIMFSFQMTALSHKKIAKIVCRDLAKIPNHLIWRIGRCIPILMKTTSFGSTFYLFYVINSE